MARKALGRGLEALLPQAAPKPLATKHKNETPAVGAVIEVDIDRVRPNPRQPREHFKESALESMASSLRERGMLQPLVVRQEGDDYQIIAGERRWRAAQLAGLQEVPVVVRDMDDRAAIAVALIENIQRENLNPLEEARALERLIEEFDMTHQQAAEAVGRSRTAVTNILRLLDLGEAVKAMVQRGELEMGHARALLALEGRVQAEAAHQVVSHGLSVRATERLVKKLLTDATEPDREAAPARRDPDLVHLEQGLSDRLGAPVQVQHNQKGKGKLIISYSSLDELDGILEHIR